MKPGAMKLRDFINFPTFKNDERGATALEFALIGSVWAILVIGVCDFGLGIHAQADIEAAAAAGTQWVATNGCTIPNGQSSVQNVAAITTAVQAATSLGSVSVSSSCFYGCPVPSGSSYTISNSGIILTTVCLGFTNQTSTAGEYASVTSTYNYTPLIPTFWGGHSTVTLTGTSEIRYK